MTQLFLLSSLILLISCASVNMKLPQDFKEQSTTYAGNRDEWLKRIHETKEHEVNED